jgi:predicted RND superfamily exporter protein
VTKFVNALIKFRWYIAILIPLITLGFAYQLKGMAFEGSYRIWFAKESKILKDYDKFREVFGNDDAITITFRKEEGIFNVKTLSMIDRITQALWETKYIARVDSLTNYQYVHANPEEPDDVIVEDFIDMDALADMGAEDFKAKEKIALGEELILERMISKDMKTTMIVARLTPKASDVKGINVFLRDAAVKIIEPELDSGTTFYLNGGPIINSAFIEIAEHDMSTFTPLVLLIVMFLLWMILRRPSAVVLSMLVVIFTFLIVLSMQTILDYKLNNFTANMPVFIVAIGIADAMHILWIYILGRKKGMDNYEAIHYSVHKNFLAVLFTSLTTSVGFASLGISHVVPIKTLGIATANAALLAFVLTILFVPALLAILNLKIKAVSHEDHKSSRFSLWYARSIIKHDKIILIATLLLFIVTAWGITYVKVDSNTIRYFDKEVPFRQGVHFVEKHLTGPMNYEIVVDTKQKGGTNTPEFMHKVETFTQAFKAKYPDVRHISSLVDVIKNFNKVLNHSETIPQSKELIAQYLLLYSFSLPKGMEINDKVDVKEQFFRISTTVNIVNTALDLEMIAWAEDWWKQTPYTAKVNGQTSMFAHMQADVTDTLIESILLALLAVTLMMMFIFKNLKLLPLIIAPNILPIALVVGVMGWLHIDIDIGVATAGAIIIGVAVDDTIHFLVKYFEARKRGDDLERSLAYVMHYAGSAILFTTIVLISAFLIFVFSQFTPNYHFGLVTASALLFAVVADLLLLPAIFSLLHRKKRTLD